jgi:hypothetical protein
MAFLLNGKILQVGIPFTTEDGMQRPANWLQLSSAEEKEAIGITEVDDAPMVDDRFFWSADNPKDLDQLKSQWIAQIKDTTNKLLAETDWMVIRKLERNVAIPAKVVAYRKAVIDECVRLESEITSKKKVETFIDVVMNQNFPSMNEPLPVVETVAE